MTFLYTKNGCPGCDKAREFLMTKGELYKEVVVDNPLLEAGIAATLGKGRILVPLLVRTSGQSAELFAPAAGLNGRFSFLKVKVASGN